jgi:STE24 endopeptidase
MTGDREAMNWILFLALALILARLAAELWLSRLNQQHVRERAASVPDDLKEVLDPATYTKAVEYTLAKAKLGQVEDLWSAGVLLALLLSGALPKAFGVWSSAVGHAAWADAVFLLLVAVVVAIAGLPLDWHAQFRLEERFGFNTTKPATWWLDHVKGFALLWLLGWPLLALILKVVDWIGPDWWLWAWLAMLGFQLAMFLLAPVLILPLFNKFTPLAAGTLRDRMLGLARRTGFRARDVFVMDGSRRSRHSNAFFTGLGRFRRIVLFDTLIQQLTEPELEAVLAHEIGHFKRKHVLKMLAGSALSALIGFYVVAWLAGQAGFARSFGFDGGGVTPTLLLAGLLGGAVSFWLSPVRNRWSRRHEYEADRFAAEAMGETGSLIGALRKLNRENLSNPAPHPLYSAFYYSHPTLPERERALKRPGQNAPPLPPPPDMAPGRLTIDWRRMAVVYGQRTPNIGTRVCLT